MSEVLKKYKKRIEYLQGLSDSFKELIYAHMAHMKAIAKGEADLEKAIDTFVKRVKAAKNIFQVEQIRKDYATLAKKFDARTTKTGAAAPGGGGLLASLGSLFGGSAGGAGKAAVEAELIKAKARGEPIELVDAAKELLNPYVDLLDGFAKGTLLLSDTKDPFYQPLRSQRAKRFEHLEHKAADALIVSLYNFFINKSNEASLVETEREELKKIIGSLTKYIQSLAVSSKAFGGKLDLYAKQIKAADSIKEIRGIQRALLSRTLEIQKVNSAVRERLSESETQLNEAQERIARLEKELEMAREEKAVDALTRVYNRGYFDEALKKSIEAFGRYKEPACLIMLDIDHFKKFNDTYGHQAGDQVLRVVAELTKEAVRASDIVARYGGEEFVVIVGKAALKHGVKVAENIRKIVGQHEFGLQGKTIQVTVSLGVSEFANGDSPASIIERADKNLYAAKEKGRDRVISEAA